MPPVDEPDDARVDETELGAGILGDDPWEIGESATGEPTADGRP